MSSCGRSAPAGNTTVQDDKGLGASLGDVVKVNTYLHDVTRFQAYNTIYREFFPGEPPARTTIGCQLAGIQIEIDCVAILPA
jgi:2-iminobutanoate/2-iminopropanoate deaminase